MKTTSYMAIFQIVFAAHLNNLNIYFLVEDNKKEALDPSNNDIYYIGNRFFIHPLK